MDTAGIVTLLQESIFMIVVFSTFLIYGMAKGRYALINVLFALYLALLISIKFPYYNQIVQGTGDSSAVAKILLFISFFLVGIILFRRHIPGDDYEAAFHKIGKKVLLAVMATVLVMIFSFHALPVTEIITPGTPIQALFASQENFFWWLILPLAVLFFV
ncbi:MAG: hypothetical protein K9M10_01195 [Candidatus Pacebacteria bacterium]|nr:hypothetical protein [Candidatus Paceibacterota bacterium]MCF7857079.1 hypothetical protein [Candidatus Paceibacterota bacterium]